MGEDSDNIFAKILYYYLRYKKRNQRKDLQPQKMWWRRRAVVYANKQELMQNFTSSQKIRQEGHSVQNSAGTHAIFY